MGERIRQGTLLKTSAMQQRGRATPNAHSNDDKLSLKKLGFQSWRTRHHRYHEKARIGDLIYILHHHNSSPPLIVQEHISCMFFKTTRHTISWFLVAITTALVCPHTKSCLFRLIGLLMGENARSLPLKWRCTLCSRYSGAGMACAHKLPMNQ